jgi:hypothetical protein
MRFSPARVIVAVAIAATAITASNALTASNTVNATVAGSGSGAISGYTVSAVAYNLNATTPANIDSVTFTLSAAATVVKAKLVAAGSTYYNCTVVSGNNWSCATTSPQATVATADQLTIVATQ